jgi:protein TonB
MRNFLFGLIVLFIITTAFNQKATIHQSSTYPTKTDTIPDIDTNENNSIVFTRAEVEPQFIGGTKAWQKFLMKNMNAEVPINNGIKSGKFTIVVQFIVEKDGSLTDIKPLTNHGYGMEEECIRLMTVSPKWQPATQNGRIVRCYKKQPITYIISER